MAVTLLQVLVLGAIAVAADDVPITWSSTPRASLACVVPTSEKLQPWRPPPPLEGDDKPRARLYRWWRGTEEIKRVPSNGTIEIMKKKDGSTEGLYQCAARHRGGLVLGYPVNLKFAYIDKFSVHPANATALIGQPFVLSCDINSGPTAAISWHRDGEPLPDDTRYHLLNNQLLITDVRSEDAGLYRCKATNIQVNKTKFSHGGRLIVEEVHGDLQPALLPLNISSSIITSRGSSIVLPCPVTGSPRPELLWLFTHPGQRTAELEDVTELLNLRYIEASQEGVYNCSIEGNPNITKSFNVIIPEPVVITVPPSSKQALRASTVRFNCTAVGNPPPKVSWYKDGDLLDLTGRKSVMLSPDGNRWELLVRSVTSADGGVYQCFASNGISTASAWAMLNVTGSSVSPPSGLQCWPLGPKTVELRWSQAPGIVMAYTVHVTKPGANTLPGKPLTRTEDNISVSEPLTPYSFKVRVYLRSDATMKNEASDLSESVTCQGQGVPIKLARLGNSIMVSWKQFARQNPGVVQWILQFKPENSSDVRNITLNGEDLSHTMKVALSKPVLIRVLGTKSLPWLHQNLTQVPWTSSAAAGSNIDDGEKPDPPKELEVVDVGSREFSIRWRSDDTDPWHKYTYQVCTTKLDGVEDCFESIVKSATVSNLQPDSNYMVRVRVTDGPSSTPMHITTKPEGPQRVKNMTYKFINATSLRVSWNSDPDKYTVHYSHELKLPIDKWASLETMGNTVLINGLDLTKSLYVMVTGYEPEAHSSILQVPIQVQEGLKYTFTGTGVKVTWSGQGPRVVKYSQNLTLSMDKWSAINVPSSNVHITGLNPSLPTYVMVSAPGPNQHSQVLTIPGRPPETSLLFLWVGVTCGVITLCALTIAAICVWRRRKSSRSPVRSHRRRNVSPREGSEEEVAEMKNIGGRLANGGGAMDSGEPLLNGHIHITENPNQSKTPNGRMRKGQRYEAAFDVARYDDPDTTLETVLDADTSTSTTYNLLDTSRRPEYDVSRSSRDVSANNSFNKLPDDNMNSELTRSTDFQLDNSKILPTLQPNG